MESVKTTKDLSPKQQKALVALLGTRTVIEAAKQASLAESTVRKYLVDPAFKKAYSEERQRMLSEAITRLQQGGVTAADVFINSLEDPDVEIKLRAARSLWEFLLRSVEAERRIKELEDLERRLEIIERALEPGNRGNGHGY